MDDAKLSLLLTDAYNKDRFFGQKFTSPATSFVFRDPHDILADDLKIPSVYGPFLLIIDRICCMRKI